jgi:hypothetical protein
MVARLFRRKRWRLTIPARKISIDHGTKMITSDSNQYGSLKYSQYIPSQASIAQPMHIQANTPVALLWRPPEVPIMA